MPDNTGGLNELKTLLTDNHEAAQLLGNVEATMQTNTDRVIDLEKQLTESGSKLSEAIGSRDKIRDIVKSELGINEFTAESVRERLATFASDDVLKARDEQFNNLRASSSNKIEELEKVVTSGKNEIRDLMMKLAISKTDIMGQTKGEHANNMLLDWISQDAQFNDNGDIVYRGPSGETLYNANSQPLTLEDRINEIKGDSTKDFVFQSRFLNGGGGPDGPISTGPAGDPHSGTKFIRSKMSFAEQKAYRTQYGEEAYNKLPLA